MTPKTALLTITMILALLHLTCRAAAQIPPEIVLTKVSPLYFGPYAFPVPDLSDATVNDRLAVSLSADLVAGRAGGKGNTDWTFAPTYYVSVPLWCDRAQLSVYGEIHEWYRETPQTRSTRRVEGDYPLAGNCSGSLYFSTTFLVLREREYLPSITLRATTQTATGDKFEVARHYDAPGYFFDLALGKNFAVGKNGHIRLSATAGFVCWQIDNGTQNDALLLGGRIDYSQPWADFTIECAGYSGREFKYFGEVSGDRPVSLKAAASFHIGDFTPFVYFQHGLRDWPYTQFRIGLAWSFDVLRLMHRKDRE